MARTTTTLSDLNPADFAGNGEVVNAIDTSDENSTPEEAIVAPISTPSDADDKSKPLPCQVSPEFHTAVTAFAANAKITVADVIRTSVAQYISFTGVTFDSSKGTTSTYSSKADREATYLKANSVERAVTNVMLAGISEKLTRAAVDELRLLRADRQAYLLAKPTAAEDWKQMLKDARKAASK